MLDELKWRGLLALSTDEEALRAHLDLSEAQLAEISPLLTPEVRSVLTVAGSIGSRDGRGGTATGQVRLQLEELLVEIARVSAWLG